MTLQEAKEQIARELGYTDWDTVDWYQLDSNEVNTEAPYAFEKYSNKAAELYAHSKWDEACEAQKGLCIDAWKLGFVPTQSPKPEFKP